MDEVTPDRDSYDYSQIDFSDQTDVDVFAAINPAGGNCSKNYEIKDFQHKDVHVERLDIRYRNSLRIALFLGHLNQYYIQKPELFWKYLKDMDNIDSDIHKYRCINMSEDKPLSTSYLPEGKEILSISLDTDLILHLSYV